MANLQVKNLPDELHRKLKRAAKRRGVTIRDLVLDVVRREMAREEFAEKLARRSSVTLERSAATALAEERAERDRELAR